VKLIIILIVGLSVTSSSAFTVLGEVADGGGRPVVGAAITFANEANPSQQFSDSTQLDGTYRVLLNASTAVLQGSLLPNTFQLLPNYPNPFNPSTLIPYQVGAATHVRLIIFNLLGQPIRTLVDRVHLAGSEVVEWDGRSDGGQGVGAGLYIVRMEAEGLALSQKMLLLDGAKTSIHVSAPRSKAVIFQPAEQALYSVRIEGSGIEVFSRAGISLGADTTLHFEVVRRPIAVEAGGDIAAAMKRAEPGDIVQLSAGTYADQVVELREGVMLRGVDSSRTILMRSFLMASRIGGTAVENLTLKNSASDTTAAISLFEAELVLQNCRIEASQTFCAIEIAGGNARVRIEQSAIEGNEGIGVWVKDGGQVAMHHNIIRDNGATGLVIESGGAGEIVDNDFAQNAARTGLRQVEISGAGSDPIFRNNIIRGRGLRVWAGASGQFIGNTIEEEVKGVAIEIGGSETNPLVQDNTVRGSIRVSERAQGQLIGNIIEGKQNGIEISGAGTNTIIRDNILRCEGTGTGTVGIQVGDGAGGQIFANTISGYGTGIQLSGRSELGRDIGDNILSNNISDIRQVNADIVWMDRFRLGIQDLKAGLFTKAAETFRRATTDAPFPVFATQAHYYLGVTLMRMEHFDEAIPSLEDVIDLDPKHPTARWNLRLSYQQLGRDPDVIEERYRLDLAPIIPPAHVPVRFTDVGEEAGVALINMGRGTAWRDLDNDGFLDLLAVEDGGSHALFHNEGDGTFVNIAEEVGLADPRGGWSALWADYDNDGAADIFVTRGGFQGVGVNSLYKNKGDGKFAEVTQNAGLDKIADSFCSAWGDYDNDGFLDLYIGNGISRKGTPNTLYRNNGDGTFADVSEQAGVSDGLRATIGVAWGDYNNDGWLDLYAVNNGGACALYQNKGDGTFADVTVEAGVIGPLFGFVAFFLDYDNDGWLDLFVSSSAQTVAEVIDSAVTGKASLFSGNRGYLYHNNQDGTFEDVTPESGLGRTLGTMAATYGDIDNDGYPDLYLANGGPAMDRFEPDRLFLNNQNGTFADISEVVGLHIIGKGHGTTMADYDNDGDLDIYSPQGGVGGNAGQAQQNLLLRNEGNENHWLFVELVGRAGTSAASSRESNRDGIGARVTVKFAGQLRYAEVNGGSGFGVTNSLPLEFGLGAATEVDEVEVRWPSGQIDRVADVVVDRKLVIVEGMGARGP
jgi:hypothetical protein